MVRRKVVSALFATAIISSGVLVNTAVEVSASNDTSNAIIKKENNSVANPGEVLTADDGKGKVATKNVTKAELLQKIQENNGKIKSSGDKSLQGAINELNNVQSLYAMTKAMEGLQEGQKMALFKNMWGVDAYQDIKLNDDMELGNSTTEEAHRETLNNATNKEQELRTMSFEKSIVNSVTTTTTETAGVSSTTTATIKFPAIGGSESFTAKFDFTHSKAENDSTTRKYTIPSQVIKVPANKKYMVKWILTRGTMHGTVNLNNVVKGVVPYAIKGKTLYGTNVGNTIRDYRRITEKYYGAEEAAKILPGWTADGDAGHKKIGAAKYEVEYGSKVEMEVVDVTDKANPVVVRTMPVRAELRK